MKKKFKERAFTLSEVIITLVVLGIVAAITVPMLSNSASDKKWNVAKQKAKATIGEAFRLMTVNGEISTTNADGTPRTTEYMVTKVLPKYLKLEKTCAPAKYADCGFSSKFKAAGGGVIADYPPKDWKWETITNSWVWNYSPTNIDEDWGKYQTKFVNKYGQTYNTNYFFRTLDGFSVALLYNPYCASSYNDKYVMLRNYVQQTLDRICLMGIYDMNGKKGPNMVGMDIGFIGSFYNGFETKTAAVLPHSTIKNSTTNIASGNNFYERAVNYCKNLREKGDWKVPDINELSLIHLNYMLIARGTFISQVFWSSSISGSDSVKVLSFDEGAGIILERGKNSSSMGNSGPWVRCVRANALK